MNRPLLLIFLLACASPFRAEEVDPSRQAETIFQEGVRLYDKGNYAAAMDRFSQALLRRPDDTRIQSYLMLSGQKLVDFDDHIKTMAAADLRKMIDQAQKVLTLRQQEMELALKKIKEAYDRSRLQDPGSLLKACRGVDILMDVSLGDDTESDEIKKYLHSLCGNLEASVGTGVLVEPADARRVAGYIAFCRSDWRKAVEEWTAALALNPGDERLKFLLSRAEENYRRALDLMREAQLMAEAEEKQKARLPAEAVPLLEEVLRINPAHGKALALLEECQEKVRREIRETGASERHRRALEDESRSRWLDAAQEWLGFLELDPLNEEGRRHLERIKELLAKSLPEKEGAGASRDVEGSRKNYAVGLVDYSEGNLKNALSRFEKSIALDPGNDYARRAAERVKEEMRYRP